MVRIGLDLMGGDYAPLEAIKGLRNFVINNDDKNIKIVVFANIKKTSYLLDEYQISKLPEIEIVDCPEEIEMSEDPIKAILSKKKSSIVCGLKALRDEQIDVFASAGNSGAVLAGALSILDTIKGITRPSFLLQYDKITKKKGVLLDVGGNVNWKPNHLLEYAFIGSVYAKVVCQIESPTIGLLNIGEEPTKGNSLYKEAYKLLSESNLIKFVGNIESRYIFNAPSDVIVCDGFTGNVLLKFAEGIYELFNSTKIENPFFYNLNYALRGGTPVVGVNGNVVVGHGISNHTAFQSMLNISKKIAKQNLAQKLKAFFQEIIS